MSKREDAEGCLGIVVAMIIVMGIVIASMQIRAAIDKRDYWILDLQRRVAELEQIRK